MSGKHDHVRGKCDESDLALYRPDHDRQEPDHSGAGSKSAYGSEYPGCGSNEPCVPCKCRGNRHDLRFDDLRWKSPSRPHPRRLQRRRHSEFRYFESQQRCDLRQCGDERWRRHQYIRDIECHIVHYFGQYSRSGRRNTRQWGIRRCREFYFVRKCCWQ